MSQKYYKSSKEDLYESGKAYRNALFGGSESSTPQQQGSSFPGLGPGPDQGYGGGFGQPGGNLPVPYQQQTPQSSSPLGNLGNLPLKDIKSFIDRMGGIEGIMNTFNKMSALMKNVQQMAPMLKLLMGSFLPKAKTTDSDLFDEEKYEKRRRRRRRRRTSSSRRKRVRYRRRSTRDGTGRNRRKH